MPYIYGFLYIAGAVLGTVIFYYIIVAAVKNGILEANVVIEKAKLEKRLAELKEKQELEKKA